MGKGGTRFVGEAIGQRTGRQKSTYTNKELKKNMEKYLETGVHPDMDPRGNRQDEVFTLPTRDTNRPHVFLEISVQDKPIGKLVIEIFEDVLPTTCSQFLNRCSYGSTYWLKGTKIHKIFSGFAIFGGHNPKAKAPAHSMRRSHRLKNAQSGCVSIALDGSDFAISLGRSLKLDEDHQVVGRIHEGSEVLEKLEEIPTSPVNDSPVVPVTISRCGLCDASGTFDTFDDEGPSTKKLSEKETADLLESEAEATKDAVKDAVLSGLNKRKVGGAEGAASVKPPAKLQKGMMGGVLGDLSDSSSSGSDGD